MESVIYNRVCNGKGIGDRDGNCKKITIAVFAMVKLLSLVLKLQIN